MHLSSMDASFLHLETPETPMHVGSLMLFELPAGYTGNYHDDLRSMLAKRLHLCALLHRKLAPMPFDLADPVWVDDHDVDLDYHVRPLTLRPPGTMAQLERLIGRLHASLLDRSRPLWEIYVIDGLQSGQVACYTKAHHAGVDGKAGVELAKVLYDTSAVPRATRAARAPRAADAKPLGVAELLRASASNAALQYTRIAKMLPQALRGVTAAARLVAARRQAAGERSLNLGLAPATVFNASVTNQRSYSTLSLSLAQMKALGQRVGGTVNTVVMAMCSGALRSFLAERNLLPDKTLIAAVPVSLRGAGDGSMNNQVSVIRVDLATDLADPAERFRAIHASSEAAKAVVAELKPLLTIDLPVFGSPWMMSGMASMAGRLNLAAELPPLANVSISNVPGIPVPLYMAGARMRHYYPVSIAGHGVALNITVQSYDGQMEFGITACRRVLSQDEAQELVEHLQAALAQIETLAPAATAAPAPAPAPASARAKAQVHALRQRPAARVPSKRERKVA